MTQTVQDGFIFNTIRQERKTAADVIVETDRVLNYLRSLLTLVNLLPARKDLRNLMDNAAGAPGIPHGDALYTADLQQHANPEEISLEVTLAETPDLEDEDSPSRAVLAKLEVVRTMSRKDPFHTPAACAYFKIRK